ncbi:GTP 3',8-cyclase MoaA [Aestuariibacter halophilus]|uniref:GTP 3',8-cyclase n=1 Tax=Fluctibacter halophilus TaxID=226011 RepID=A0ABS8G4V0_9ALTE|nr:GTP 3',8-cyclase MoaA [Aestuariibacter halophilus]MCC2615544.1 GTP 3',8-cyclase MoaA [Aestuariibacter halophilus]
MLQDPYGRRFHYLRLSVTDVCNFRCDYCLPDGYEGDGPSGFLSVPEIERLVRGFAAEGTRKLRITGGEPSLRKDLGAILSRCRAIDGIEKLAITTNGHRLARHLPMWRDAGVDQINISIDSLDARVFHRITGHDQLHQILQAIEQALAMGFKIKVNAVLMRGVTEQGMTDWLGWLKQTPVTLRLIELMETGDHGRFFNQYHTSGEPLLLDLLSRGWTRQDRTLDAGPAIELSHPEYAGQMGFILPYSKDFCTTCNRLRVSATGDLHLCLFAEQGLSLRDYLQQDDTTELRHALRRLLQDKGAKHWLDEGKTGATRHLAMIGG